jgi:chemotaxis protein methyltransferase CheR
MNLELSAKEFALFKGLIYQEFGISLSDRKKTLVQTRLRKWVQSLGLPNYEALYRHVEQNPHELVLLADAITTNVTSFFREESQWLFLEKHVPKVYGSGKKLRIWSAACSSGQEPYTIAMFLMEVLPDPHTWDIKILATDLSYDILKKAQKGHYRGKDLEGMPKKIMARYFTKLPGEMYAISEKLKEMITFRSFNLVTGNYAMFSRPFNLVFCRNVMIYFDKDTQQKVIDNLLNLLPPKGLLLIGHSESITRHDARISSIAPSIYEKRGA